MTGGSAMATATTYDTDIRHQRSAPVRNAFRYRSRSWLVDLDTVPQLPPGLRWLGRFESRDHLGDPTTSLRANVDAYLATQGIDVTGGRVLMLANPRALGHCFNPISVFWCYDATDELAAVVAEVHNTYGDRHAYLLRHGTQVPKRMYVSPFNPVSGDYTITVSPPDASIAVTVVLHRDGHPPFAASLHGRRRPPRSAVVEAMSTAWVPLATSFLIRLQGIRLWRRGVRVEPRPVHARQQAVS